MNVTIQPGLLQGILSIIPSKSQAHRMLICAAFADKPTKIYCPETNRDMEATTRCLSALGSDISWQDGWYQVRPTLRVPQKAELFCQESGSTLRFLLPVVGALGVDGVFHLEGRLPQRPLSPLWEELERMGCSLSRPTQDSVRCQGKLRCGQYTIDGSVSSQYISGLMMALSLMQEPSALTVTGRIESKPYIAMTRQVLELFGVSGDVLGGAALVSPGTLEVEGDWSNAAFFLAANALGSQVEIQGLRQDSCQGDRAVKALLEELEHGCPRIDCSDIPDLVPILSVVAACKHGAVFQNIRRLRLKESDRVEAVVRMIRALAGHAEAQENTLTVHGTGLDGGSVDAFSDHRIAMSAAIAATAAKGPVTIMGAEAVEKSYPRFFQDFTALGGKL